MSCDQVKAFETLTQEVLLFVETNQQNNVLDIFNKYKIMLFPTSTEQNSHESDMEVEEIDVGPDNKVEKKRMEFYKSLMLSLHSDSQESPPTTIMASYNSFNDLLQAMAVVKKQLDKDCVGVVQKSIVMGKLLWISKRFNRFKEALSHSGYSKSWANFLINLYKLNLRHPNISKSSLSLHALRSNLNFLNDIEECLPEFDEFNW